MPQSTEKKPFLGLSLTQLVGGSAAAATAAVLGSRLGTTGTIIGAALVSVVSAVASAAYTASLRRTKVVVARTRELLPNGPGYAGRARVLPQVPDQPDGSAADVTDLPEEPELRAAEEVAEQETPPAWRRIGWKPVAVAAGVFFVVTALLVTGTELVTGESLSGSSGTTVSHAFHGGEHRKPEPTPSAPPGGSTPATPRTTPTTAPSESPSTGASESPSATPSPSEAPSEAPSQAPSDVPTS